MADDVKVAVLVPAVRLCDVRLPVRVIVALHKEGVVTLGEAASLIEHNALMRIPMAGQAAQGAVIWAIEGAGGKLRLPPRPGLNRGAES